MTTLDERTLYDAFARLIGPAPRQVVLHSALYPLRVEGDALKWPLLGALRRLTDNGHTLALPAFTFSFCRGQDFDPRRSPSETGLLADWLLELEGARRSPHPIYSFVMLGGQADAVLACPNRTTFGDDSCFDLFERENACLLTLGCGWDACTQFHRYEEEAQVPYRHYKDFSGTLVSPRKAQSVTARMFVRDFDLDPEPVNDFAVAVSRLREQGQISHAELGDATLEAVSCQDFAATCRDLLADDPYSFIEQPEPVRYALQQRQRRDTSPPLKLALLGGANLDLLKTAVERSLSEVIADRRIEVYTAPFGQAERELLTEGSALAKFEPDVLVFADRLEDLLKVDSLDLFTGPLAPAVEHYAALVQAARERFTAPVFALSFAALEQPAFGTADAEADDGVHRKIQEANHRLSDDLVDLAGVHLLDLDGEARRFQGDRTVDPRLWFLGRIPFSPAFSEALATRIAGMVLAATGRSLRLLVLDLDNTLWGGVLGEDGLAGLQLGGDYPGNAYRHFQQTLKRLGARGIALALASKNDEAEARRALAELPDMAIRETDLAAWRIDWQDKPGNLAAMAAELGLGLESIGFVDDNPAERARMRLALPAVKVIELPDDPARYAESLLATPYLECLTLTDEDRKRAKQYVARRASEQERQRFTRVEDFYSYLQPKLTIAPLLPSNAMRAEQLAMKTNQFNTTCQRYDRAELEALQAGGQGVYVIALEDRFSERENIGLAVVHWNGPTKGAANIACFLLSCRVLGRGVESGVLGWLAEAARRRGLAKLIGQVREQPRNQPARDVYAEHGFSTAGAPGFWALDLKTDALAVPSWITLVSEESEAEHAA